MKQTFLFKIEADKFINIIGKDPKLFMNFFRICVKRFKYNKRVTDALSPLSDKSKDAQDILASKYS